MSAVILSDPIELALKSCKERIDIFVRDDATPPAPVAATSVELTVTDLGDVVQFKDAFPVFTLTGTVTVAAAGTIVTGTDTLFLTELDEGDSVTIAAEVRTVDKIFSNTSFSITAAHTAGATDVSITKATRIVNPGVGTYYIDWGDDTAAANNPKQSETNSSKEFMFNWKVNVGADEQESVVQVVKVVSARSMGLLPYFRTLIDKSIKRFDTDPDNPCFLGYTDANLMQYLEEGLTIINAYEPYPVWNSLDEFPHKTFLHILLESALIAGILSQQMYAIDEDVPNFSDQGNTFVIQHGPQLAAVLNAITGRLDRLIPMMKLKFIKSGSVHIEAGANFRLTTLLQSSPNGALFRNIAFRG